MPSSTTQLTGKLASLVLLALLVSQAATAPRVRADTVIRVQLSPITTGPSPLTSPGPSLGRPTPPPQTTDRPYTTLSVDVSSDQTLTQPLLDAINSFRRKHRLSTLTLSAQLTRAAGAHLYALAYSGTFQHAWPGGPGFATWIRRFYPIGNSSYWSAGENLIWTTGSRGSLTAGDALNAWIASPPHRHNLLTPDWREIGIATVAATDAQGLFAGQNVLIAATDFGARR